MVAQLGENVILDELITFHKKSRKMARLVSGAFEEASAEDVDSVSSIAHAEIHDDISLEPKVVPGKSKGGVFDPGDEVDSKFERTSDSLKSISLDAEEKATSQANPMADSRRTNTVVETIEYLQEIGNNGEDKESNSSKKSESKIVMPILTEIDDAEDVKSEGCDAEQHSSRNKESCPWNYATALDENDITSHRHLVCVPKSLNSSVIIMDASLSCYLGGLGEWACKGLYAFSELQSKLATRHFLGWGR